MTPNNEIGDLIFTNKTLYGSEIIFDYNVTKVKDNNLSESKKHCRSDGFINPVECVACQTLFRVKLDQSYWLK